MKKKINKIMIMIFIFCFIFSISASTEAIYNNTDRNVIYGISGDQENIIRYNLNDERTFTEIVVAGRKIKIVNIVHGGAGYNIVDQPNVYCVQHNRTFGYEAYSVGSKINVTDPMLAYILCKGPQMSDGLQTYDEVPSQLALWKYIAMQKSDDVNIITANGTVNPIENDKGQKYETLTGLAKEIYDNAETWKTAKNNYVNPALTANIKNNKLEIQIAGSFEKFKLTVNGTETSYTKEIGETKTVSLDISSLGNAEKASIKLDAYGTDYAAQYRILGEKQYDYDGGYYELIGNNRRQRMIVVTDTTIKNTSKTIEVQLDSDVSLQKYITKINGKDITTNDTSIDKRSGLKSSEADNKKETSAYYLRYNKNVKPGKNGNDGIDARTPYKYDVPVKIDYGDKVTYKIEVHNNENRTAAGITVADKLPYYKEKGKDTLYVTLKSIKDKNGKTISAKTDENNTRLKFGPISLDANASTWYEITVEFNKKYYKDSPIVNTAWLEGNVKDYYKNNARPNIHRIADRDYVQMKQYAVSLEKYVVKVGKNNLISDTNNANYNSSIADRSGHPYYNENGYDKSDDKNKVRVEPGDTITFNIRVRNTGDKNGNYGAIKVKQIGDIPIPPTQLKYDTTYEITGNGGGKLEGNIFKFDSAQLIEPGSYVDIEVRYKLEISKDDTISSINSIKNTAVIKIITNRNDKEVEDSDGTDNNVDMDYLKTKIYAVGIEKYVTGVGTKDNANSLVTNPNNINYNCATAYRSGKERQAKKDDAVRVEPGDYVTFTIKVKNTGTDYVNYGKINTTTISEVFSNKDNEYKLVYAGITGATYDKKQITFVQDIVPGGSATFTIKFEVEVARDKTNYKQLLYNAAQINDIKNGNGTPVKDSKEETDKDNEDRDYLLTKIYAVGIEKYVTGVGENGLITSTDDINYNCNVNSRENHPQYNKNGYDKSLEANRVRVEPGDYVTFTIKVKNTGTKDGKADYVNYGKISTTTISESFTENANCKLLYDSITGATYDKKQITFKKDIVPGGSATFTIKFKVEVTGTLTGAQQNLENTVTIDGANSLSNKNSVPVKDSDGDKNNTDSDYLRTKIYAVGIEKYVTGVGTKDNANSLVTNPNNINYNCATAYRSGKERQAKKDDAVRVEPGDYVTFTIKVKNTGTDYVNYGKINTTTISEVFSNKDNEYKLVYAGITGATYDKKQITFVQDIVPGGSATFTIKFEVEVARDKTNYKQLLYNAAQINDIKNGNGTPVKDSKEETDNDNEDKDYLLTKIYKVALEKYVTKVNGYDLSTTAGKDYNVKELTDRKGKPTYDTDKSKAKSKANDIVNLETGDKVTFAIIIKNIGDDYKNYGTVKTLNITDTSSDELKYNDSCSGARYSDGNITGVSAINVGDETTISLEYMVELNKNQTKQKIDLYNHAEIVDTSIINKNDISVKDSDGDKNNKDEDYLRTKVYAVSLEKYVSKVSKVVDKSNYDITDKINMGPKKDDKEKPREGYAEHNYNNEETTEENCDKTKRRNPVTTVTGDTITYTIKLKNDSEAKTGIDTNKNSNHDTTSYNTAVKIGKVIDYLPNGMKYGKNEYTNDNYEVTYDFETSNGQNLSNGRLLYPGETAIVTITAEVIEDKMSLNILKNVAEINEDSLTNKNGSKVYDTTENNNKDADYIQLNYKHDPNPNNPDANPDPGNNAFFAGTVWNDMAPDKESEYYNTIMDNSERKLSGIKVDLYRNSYKKENNEMDYTPITKTIVATTITDENGNYSFGDQDIHLENQRENYIKGPKRSNEDNRWAGYYGYYIVFTYDGITYTSTNNGIYFEDIYNSTKDYTKDSNASEYNVNESEISGYTTRKDFNSKFATINNSTKIQDKEIQYDRVNESGYIPESTYKYDPEIMSMKSLTKEIDLSTFMGMGTDKCLECSKYIGLGLRGRDIFDLELTSDVSKVEVKVNGITGTYDYTNKIGVRRGDVDASYYQDMANKYISEMGAEYVGELNGKDGQKVRQTDLIKDKTNSNYGDEQLLKSILVTYKIKVSNASKTEGEATKVINYFDKNYKTDNITVTNGTVDKIDSSNSKYNSILINANSNEIDITYELNNAKDLLKDLGDKKLTTYNMSEIYEYTTTQYGDKDERTYTKGILDKDSAPGSVETEKASLTDEQISGDTTVDYYFEATNLDKLKYEDDTYATPTLYFTTPGSIRVLKGTVFEDYTTVLSNRVRTGNGKKDDDEPGISNITVELIEGDKVRYRTKTDENGNYYFSSFLPGENYIIKYYYGDNEETFYVTSPNEKSYNGEDFQSTNNKYKQTDDNFIHTERTPNTAWYVTNVNHVSVADDDTNRRMNVSTNACALTDNDMQVLNNVRDGKNKVEAKKSEGKILEAKEPNEIKDELYMYALTPKIKFGVEDSKVVTNDETKENEIKENSTFEKYEVIQMDFGIAEVPITTIDLQKHVKEFTLTDSTGENIMASAEIDEDNSTVAINKFKVNGNARKEKNVISALKTISFGETKYNSMDGTVNDYVNIKTNVNSSEIQELRKAINKYSLGEIIKVIPTWKRKGDVTAGVKSTSTVLNVQIQDEKLQGAKLKVVYEISESVYVEKNYDNSEGVIPTIKGIIDVVDNNLSYNSDLNSNKDKWLNVNAEDIRLGKVEEEHTTGRNLTNQEKLVTTTFIKAKTGNPLLINIGDTGTGEATEKVTLEKILSSTDSTIAEIITSSIDSFEYKNEIKISELSYANTKTEDTGGFVFKDRVRTPDRYIVLPGVGHYSATSETISITPPTGDTSTHTMYYIIGAAGLAVLAIGAFGIKKFVLKGKSTKK